MRALEHRAREVREAAVRMILDLYAQHRSPVLEHLPPDDSAARRNVLYKTLFEGFARIDGRPADTQVRVSPLSARVQQVVAQGTPEDTVPRAGIPPAPLARGSPPPARDRSDAAAGWLQFHQQ